MIELTDPKKGKLVRRSLCECGAASVWEHVPLGKLYVVFPETAEDVRWMCTQCGREHVSKMVVVIDEAKPIGTLFLDLFEISEW